jgi:2-oxo-4-hydroxy-4-carboxy--5-ureidoimidazoline (OHCU) decarboxylase
MSDTKPSEAEETKPAEVNGNVNEDSEEENSGDIIDRIEVGDHEVELLRKLNDPRYRDKFDIPYELLNEQQKADVD